MEHIQSRRRDVRRVKYSKVAKELKDFHLSEIVLSPRGPMNKGWITIPDVPPSPPPLPDRVIEEAALNETIDSAVTCTEREEDMAEIEILDGGEMIIHS